MARRQVNIYINGRQVTNTIKDITAEKRKLTRELNRMVVGSEEYNQKIRELDSVNGVIRKHRDALRPVSSSYDKMTAGLKNFAGFALAAFSADAIISFGKELFKLGREMEVLGAKAQTVFGQALPQVTAAANDNAKAMGLTISAYTDAAAAIGDLLVPMGFQREEAAEISTQLVNLSGALSEWTGGQVTAEQASSALSKALLGEREELKTLGIAISEADVQARLAAKGMKELTGQLLEQAKAGVTLELILEKSSDAQTAFAENSETLVRKQAELNATLNQIRETLATALFPVFQRIVSTAAILADATADIIDNFTGVGTAGNSASQGVARLNREFNIEIETLARGNLSQENRARLIDQINVKYRDYLPNLIKETDSIEQLRDAQRQANDAFRERITLLATQEAFQKIQTQLVTAKARELELQVELTRAQENFNRAAEAGRTIVGADDRAQRQAVNALQSLNSAKAAVEENIEAQSRLQKQYEDLQRAAAAANINLFPEQEEPDGTDDDTGNTPVDADKTKQEVDKSIEQLQRLKEAVDELQRQFETSQLQEEEQAVARVRERYRKQIEEATRLEAEGLAEATQQRIELERLQEAEIDVVRQEFNLKRIEGRKEAEAQIRLALADEFDQQLIQLAQQYAELIMLAQEYGLDVTELQRAYEVARTQLQTEQSEKRIAQEKKEVDERIEAQRKMAEAYASGFAAVNGAVGAFRDAFSDGAVEIIELNKLLALAQVGISSAEAIAKATAASAGVPFPGNLAAIATAVGTVVTNIAAARNILRDTKVPQRFEGGPVSVTGAQDGRTYQANPIGRPGTGMLPPGPALVTTVGGPILANERGQEYFVSAQDMRNPTVLNYVRAIENLRLNRSGALASPLPQRQEGGVVQNQPGGIDPGALTSLLEVNRTLVEILRAGISARIEDETIIDLFERFDVVANPNGQALR